MWSMTSLVGLLLAWCMVEAGGQHAFMRDVRAAAAARRAGEGSTRRVFGGEPAPLEAFPGVAALLDRYWAAQCSAAWLSSHWVVTAAHCVTPRVAYVRYNARRPHDNAGDAQPVLYLYRHPKFKVVQEDEGRGQDVTLLHHDIGLVRTQRAMTLRVQPTRAPLVAMRAHAMNELGGREVSVLGFGDTGGGGGKGGGVQGGELYAVRLRLVWCERGAWYHCVCAVSAGGDTANGTTAGVCAGDSGGPVVGADGAQLAVTSMGPMACAARAGAPQDATSVLTATAPYLTLLNTTMRDADAALLRRSNAPYTHCSLILTAAWITFIVCFRYVDIFLLD